MGAVQSEESWQNLALFHCPGGPVSELNAVHISQMWRRSSSLNIFLFLRVMQEAYGKAFCLLVLCLNHKPILPPQRKIAAFLSSDALSLVSGLLAALLLNTCPGHFTGNNRQWLGKG